MESTIWFTDGFVVITGEIGAGKTTLIETFLRELQPDVVVAQINQTQLSPTAFLQTVLVQFGFTPFDMKKPEVLATLNQFLTEQHVNGRKVLLIVDEAQNLSYRVLEEIRMLSGIETTKEKVLRIILAGTARAQRQAQFQGARSAHAARAPAVPLDRAHRRRNQLLYRSSARSRRLAGAADFCGGDLPDHLQIYGRRAALDQHLVRHLHDGRIRPRQRGRHHARTSSAAIRELQWVEFAPAPIACSICPAGQTIAAAMRRPGSRSGRILLASGGKTILERELQTGPTGDRPNPGQRSADRQQVHQPAPLPDRDAARLLPHRRSQQHQRHLRASPSACAGTT